MRIIIEVTLDPKEADQITEEVVAQLMAEGVPVLTYWVEE